MDWNRKTKIVFAHRKTFRKKERYWSLVFIIGVGFFVLLYGIYWFLNYSKVQIKNIEIRGAETVDTELLRNFVRSYEKEKILGIFPKAQYLLFDSSEVASRIKSNFLRIRELSVDKKAPDSVSITVRERALWGIACSGVVIAKIASLSPPFQEESICAYIDEFGFAFERSPVLFGSLVKKIFTGDRDASLGTETVSSERIQTFDVFREELSRLSISVTALALNRENPRDVRIYAGDWYLLIDRDSHVSDVMKVLKPLLTKELAGKMGRLEYIDLRFGNKVFYKLKK